MFLQLRPAVTIFLILTLVTGVVYPLAITGISQAVFHHQANGSLIIENGGTIGSELIGQYFDDPRYFWGRPSATSPVPYNAGASTGSNHSISNPVQMSSIAQRVERWRRSDPGNSSPIPTDLVTASGSGLDPHISVAAARWQIPRVARVRRMPIGTIDRLVAAATAGRQFGILGEPVVNVLRLNLSLDASTSTSTVGAGPGRSAEPRDLSTRKGH